MRTMTDEEIIKVVQASMDGKQIEFSHKDEKWQSCGDYAPNWDFHFTHYRVKELTLKEFIRDISLSSSSDSDYDNGARNACSVIFTHMKKLQGEVR